MDYRMYEKLEGRLRDAIQSENTEEVEVLLEKKAFRMVGEEMDELLEQLGSEKLRELQESLGRKRRAIDVLSKEAQLKQEVESNDFGRVYRYLEKERDYFGKHVKSSSIAIYAIRAAEAPKHAIIELLFQKACEVELTLWDSAVALPLLYDVLSATPATTSKDTMLISSIRLCAPSAFLQLAAKSGDVPMLDYLLSLAHNVHVDCHIYSVYVGDAHRATALLRASHHGQDAVVAKLVEMGSDRYFDHRDRDGRTALHLAASEGHANIVQLLLDHYKGKRMSHRHSVRSSSSASGNNLSVPTESVDGKAVPSPHSRRGSHAASDSLNRLADVFNVDSVDRWGMTALHLAACRGHSAVIKSLLGADADPLFRAPEKPLDFSLYLDTYLTVCENETQRNEEHMKPVQEETVTVTMAPAKRRTRPIHPRNDCFRLDPVMSFYWQPGGFTALHFAVVYGGDEKAVEHLMSTAEKSNLVCMKDSNGLTAFDWATAMRKSCSVDEAKHEKYKQIVKLTGQRQPQQIDGSDVFAGDKACAYVQVMEKMVRRKEEIEWCDRIGWALRNGHFAVAESLASKLYITQLSPTLSSSAVQHLKWAASGPCKAIRQKWKCDREKRKYLKAKKGWTLKVERVMVAMIKSAEVVMEPTELQSFMVWALRKGMANLAIELSKHEDCELMEPLQGGAEGLAPLDAVTAWQTKMQEIEPVLNAMESRKDVKERVSKRRELFVSYLNTLLVAAVLIGTLAFSAILQPPVGFKSSLQKSSSSGNNNNSVNVNVAASAVSMNLLKDDDVKRLSTSTISAAAPAVGSYPAEDGSKRVDRLAQIFVWSTHISFFFSIISAFACITGAIPPVKGQLAYSQRRIQHCMNLAMGSIVLAVVAITFSFSSAILYFAEEAGKERTDLKMFAIVVGCLGSTVLLWMVVWLIKTWEPVREIALQLKRRFPNESSSRRTRRCLGLLGIVLIILFLEWIYPILAFFVLTTPCKRWVQLQCIGAAENFFGGSSNAAILYKSLRTVGVHFAEEESDSDEEEHCRCGRM